MPGTLAQVIQGEAGSDPTNQFAVASTIYNRAQLGTFPGGSDPTAIVNAPQQYTGFSASPNASAQALAQAIQDGTLSSYGNTGNAVNFMSGSAAANNGLTAGGANIGGNFFSDNLGPPTKNFIAPSFAPDQFSVSTTPGSQDQSLIQDGQTLAGATPSSDSGASFEFSPNQPVEASQGIPVAQNAANYADFGLQPVGNADPLAAQTTGTDYGAFGLSPLDSSLGNTLFGGALPNAVTGGGTAGTGVTAAGGSDFFSNLLNNIWTLTQRGGLIVLGVVLVGVGGYWLAAHSETKIKLVH